MPSVVKHELSLVIPITQRSRGTEGLTAQGCRACVLPGPKEEREGGAEKGETAEVVGAGEAKRLKGR